MLATLWRLIEVQNHEHAFNSLCLGKLGKTHIDVAGIAARILQLIDTIGQPIDPLPTPPSPSLTSSHPYLPFAAWSCLLNHLRALQKFFPAIVGRLANVIGRRLETADRRLRPTQLSFIAIPSLGLLYLLRHFNAIFMRIFAHCNGPLSQYKRCENYFNCDSCNASRWEGALLFLDACSNSHFTFSTHYLVNYIIIFTSQVSQLYLTNFKFLSICLVKVLASNSCSPAGNYLFNI